eukprot:700195-Rhodomonas_salina.5
MAIGGTLPDVREEDDTEHRVGLRTQNAVNIGVHRHRPERGKKKQRRPGESMTGNIFALCG